MTVSSDPIHTEQLLIGGDDEIASTPSVRYRWPLGRVLRFRGEDTRHNFTETLYRELTKNGIRTFRDDEELERGEEIAPSLVDAIQDSAAAIAVISNEYTSSRWCLEELAKIVEYKKLMLPVFFRIDPSDVSGQKGPFEEDFVKLEQRFGEDQVGRWRRAMEKAD
ncbi:toll/interleukin-1 receptor-like protein [Pistacia vera]|uniref:toll/interleukin-1 receptor-like protein n=1 Tax=Pistacia vera TaxID=55513 RepID=UPI001263CBCF|nr:toll/interleukin-1 receptor-like protein [Pistacia vera]